MATVRLADVVYGPMFLPSTVQETQDRSLLRTSGIAGPDAQLQRFAAGPGDVVTIPFWSDLSGNSNASTDDPAQNATPNKIGMGSGMARKIRRNNGWQAANLVSALMAEDPLDVIRGLVANYWVREEQRILILMLNGVFASALAATHVLNVASEDANTDGINMDSDVSANAHALLGDQGLELVAVAMHSRVFWNLDALGMITYENLAGEQVAGMTPAERRNRLAFWHGKRVLVSDSCPRVAGSTSGFKYTSYFFANDAMAYADATGTPGGPEIPVELDSKAEAGNGEGVRTLWYRRHFVMHVRGLSFTGTPASASGVTDAELATGANWARIYDPKLIRVVAVITNG